MQVILEHEDFNGRQPRFNVEEEIELNTDSPFPGNEVLRSDNSGVSVKVVREPRPKYVLILESSSSMI